MSFCLGILFAMSHLQSSFADPAVPKTTPTPIPSETSERANEGLAHLPKEWTEKSDCGPGLVPGAEKIPVLNQGSQGTCYAEAAATLINFQTQKKDSAPVVSPAAIAAGSKKNRESESARDPVGGGFVCQAFRRTDRFCEMGRVEEAISSLIQRKALPAVEEYLKAYGHKTTPFRTHEQDGMEHPVRYKLKSSLKKLKSIRKAKEAGEGGPKTIKPWDTTALFVHAMQDVFNRGNTDDRAERLDQIVQSVNAIRLAYSPQKDCDAKSEVGKEQGLANEAFKTRLQGLERTADIGSFFSLLMDEICRGAPSLEDVIPKTSCKTGLKAVKLDQLLEDGKIVSVSIDTNAFMEKWSPTGFNDHAMVVVGTAKDSKDRCGYLVRNSWGKSCERKHKKEYDCRDGTILIPKEEFKDAVHSFQWLETD